MQYPRRTVRLMPTAMTVALAAGLLTATVPTAQAAAGATLPFTSVEAESATTTGTKIGPTTHRAPSPRRPPAARPYA